MPNFQIFKYLKIAALALFILDFVLIIISTNGLGLANLFIPALLQAMVITYLNRYGNYLNEEDYSKIQSGEWQDMIDTKGYLFGIYCIIMGALNIFVGLALWASYNESKLDLFQEPAFAGNSIFLFHAVVVIFYGLIVIYFVIMTFILLRNRFPKGDDSQILDKEL